MPALREGPPHLNCHIQSPFIYIYIYIYKNIHIYIIFFFSFLMKETPGAFSPLLVVGGFFFPFFLG